MLLALFVQGHDSLKDSFVLLLLVLEAGVMTQSEAEGERPCLSKVRPERTQSKASLGSSFTNVMIRGVSD